MAGTHINLNETAYGMLKKLKRPGQSFSDVVIENLQPPADTCGELLEVYERVPAPSGLNLGRMERSLGDRKRRGKRHDR
jgi:predicted CopG family antitoxin